MKQHLITILNDLINKTDTPDDIKNDLTNLLNEENTLSEDEWCDKVTDKLNELVEQIYAPKEMDYDSYINTVKEHFNWGRNYNFETMGLDKMLKLFKDNKNKCPFEQMVEVIPFKDSISYIEDLCYMFGYIFNWQDIPSDYDVTVNNKANEFLNKLYPYTLKDDLMFTSIKAIKNYVNVYNKVLDMDKKRELCNEIVSRLIYTESDLKDYQKSYNILKQLNKDGIEDIIGKYKFMALIDDRSIEDMVPEDL